MHLSLFHDLLDFQIFLLQYFRQLTYCLWHYTPFLPVLNLFLILSLAFLRWGSLHGRVGSSTLLCLYQGSTNGRSELLKSRVKSEVLTCLLLWQFSSCRWRLFSSKNSWPVRSVTSCLAQLRVYVVLEGFLFGLCILVKGTRVNSCNLLASACRLPGCLIRRLCFLKDVMRGSLDVQDGRVGCCSLSSRRKSLHFKYTLVFLFVNCVLRCHGFYAIVSVRTFIISL